MRAQAATENIAILAWCIITQLVKNQRGGTGASRFDRVPICSGVSLGIVHPEVVPLGIAVGQVRAADTLNPIQHVATGQHALAQVRPVLPAAPTNHVINGRKAQTAGVDVAVVHTVDYLL